MPNKSYADRVNRSYSRTFSRRQFLPRILHKYIRKGERVLDFGAGPDAYGTMALRSQGFSVTAHDIGRNRVAGIHDPGAMKRKYHVIFASNVLNVQPSRLHVQSVISVVKSHLLTGGKFFCNFPESPRYNDYTVATIEKMLVAKFSMVQRISKHPVAWMCVK